jgi:hypothetical protein
MNSHLIASKLGLVLFVLMNIERVDSALASRDSDHITIAAS